ncbi:hypothetical protein AsAng_0049240 [Aureispira anguillae]|uniref:Uncharacterized protein n=1 Tax=Aureispira anguillae TaxID=2864201 RepID=A0A915YJJ0_9BACT|nr:hypothetical protein AsAng_0049240 [Aureispira anguillae]
MEEEDKALKNKLNLGGRIGNYSTFFIDSILPKFTTFVKLWKLHRIR